MSKSALEQSSRKLSAFLQWDGEVDFVGRASFGLKAVLQGLLNRYARRVAMSPIVCQDVVSAVVSAGYEPFFIDVDPVSGEVPLNEWKRAHDAGCKIAVVVHLYGRLVNLRSVREIFASPECLVIDDAAQAFGSTCDLGFAGTMGDVGLVSFGPSKHITTGGAAVLHRSTALAAGTRDQLDRMRITKPQKAEKVEGNFRRRFDWAREALMKNEDASQGFVGLLAGYDKTICQPLDIEAVGALEAELEDYPERAQIRLANARQWSEELDHDRLEKLNYRDQDVPWRYACRLVGASWRDQQVLARKIRKAGIDTSNWYLPAHWYFPKHDPLPGAESFSREVFQFWVEPGIDGAAISANAVRINQILMTLAEHSPFGAD